MRQIAPLDSRWLRHVRPQFEPRVARAVRVDTSSALLLAVFTGLTAPFIGLVLRRELGATPLQLSVMASASAACLLLSVAFARALGSRRPLPYVVWPGFLARGLFLAVPFVTSAWSMVGIQVGAALAGAVQGPAQAALVQQIYPRAARGRALGAVRVMAGLFALALAMVAGQLIGAFSYQWVFLAAALFGMASSLRLRALPVPPPVERDEPAPPPRTWQTLRSDRPFRQLLLGCFVFGSGVWLQMPAMPLLLVDELGVTTSQLGLFAAAGAGAALLANACWGRLLDRWSSVRTLKVVYAVGVMTALVNFSASSPWMLTASFVTEAVMTTGLDLVWMMAVMDVAGPRRTAHYIAISAMLAGVRGIVGPLAGGALMGLCGVRTVFLVAAILMLVGLHIVTRQARSAREAAPATA